MYFFGFSNNRIVSIFMLLAILVLSLALSAYLPVLEGLDGEAPTDAVPTGGVAVPGGAVPGGAQSGGAQSGGAQSGGAQSVGETDINKIIAAINAKSQKPTETVEKKTINGIVLNDKYTEQTIDASALANLLKSSTQVKAIMNPTLPPTNQ